MRPEMRIHIRNMHEKRRVLNNERRKRIVFGACFIRKSLQWIFTTDGEDGADEGMMKMSMNNKFFSKEKKVMIIFPCHTS